MKEQSPAIEKVKKNDMNTMESLNAKAPINAIHARGLQAIIDGDRQVIIGEVHPDKIVDKISSLERTYANVSQDADGDIIVYKDDD